MLRYLLPTVFFCGVLADVANAREYPCPSDPGFCYRDFGSDGCFDSGVDEGPINAEIQAANGDPVAEPGSIICPPSVKDLPASISSIRLATDPGSDILFYAARISTFRFELLSGGEILLGGKILGNFDTILQAQGDIAIEKDVRLNPALSSEADLTANSAGGNVTFGPKAHFFGDDASFTAPAGNVSLLDGAVLTLRDTPHLNVDSGGVTRLIGTKIDLKDGNPSVVIAGGEVEAEKKLSIKTRTAFGAQRVDIVAMAGDVTIERIKLSTNAPISIQGANVTIGVGDGSATPRSKIFRDGNFNSVEVLATGQVRVDNVALTSQTDVTIETSGTTVDVIGSTLKGRSGVPDITISGGTGSVCDLSDTKIVSANLITHCDTIIGP